MIGKWAIEENRPYGFVVRNTDESSCGVEYHFYYDSNGWISAKQKNADARVLNVFGQLDLTPVLCDKESTKKYDRIQELKNKGFQLSQEESKELLNLCGLIKEK